MSAASGRVLPDVGGAVFDLVPNALVIVTTTGSVTAINQAAADLIGAGLRDRTGTTLQELFVEDAARVTEALGRWQRAASPRPAGLTLRGADGTDVPVQVRGSRMAGTDTVLLQVQPQSEAARHFAYLSRDVEVRDLRELRQRLQATLAELSRSNRRLAATNEELEQYASLISHDLRGPLSAIRQFAALLLTAENEVDEDTAEMLGAIDRLSEKATLVADSLLKLARAGSFDGVAAPVDARWALDTAIEQLRAEADHDLAVHAAGLPSVAVHEPHLVQIFANLIGNAMRYRHQDRPLRVDVSAQVSEGWARFVVTDNGIGVAEVDRDRIFVPNVRGTNVTDDEGTGLGLALCRRLASGYGGSIELVADPGPGAAFAFSLPAADG